MAEEKPLLHIDTDWKRQAQEEKKRLAEQEAKKVVAPAAPQTGPLIGAGPAASPARPGADPRQRPAPGGFSALVQTILTQVLFYLGELTTRGAEPSLNLDAAKNQIDTLGTLEEKTRGNLTEDEQRLLDLALYETRTRYIGIASQLV
jgi:hypothetical protein